MVHITNNKVIPLIKQESTKILPTFLKTKLYIDFSKPEDFEFSYDDLIRTIHNSPIFKKPPVGDNPFKEEREYEEKKENDGVLELMKIVVDEFNSSSSGNYVYYSAIKRRFPQSRIFMDLLIDQAVERGLIRRDSIGHIILLDAGKLYAINNDIA